MQECILSSSTVSVIYVSCCLWLCFSHSTRGGITPVMQERNNGKTLRRQPSACYVPVQQQHSSIVIRCQIAHTLIMAAHMPASRSLPSFEYLVARGATFCTVFAVHCWKTYTRIRSTSKYHVSHVLDSTRRNYTLITSV